MNRPIRFGTDGVRGLAGDWPINIEGAEIIGHGIGVWSDAGTVCVGMDTRESSPELGAALIRGLVRAGCAVVEMGVVPTAAVSCLAASDPSIVAGVMLTASHNAWHDNGIKVVTSSGEKLSDPSPISDCFYASLNRPGGSVRQHPDPAGPWKRALPTVNLDNRRILFDAANGAAFDLGRMALEEAGAEVLAVASQPNGRNINHDVGAMCPPQDLHDCDLAICLDGDGDRLVMVDPTHGILDGDDILWMLAQQTAGPVIGTVMTNGGLEAALQGRLIRTGVGDAKVHAEMARSGAQIGGEPSGHTMIAGGMPTSDGLYTALRVLKVAGNGPLPVSGWTRLPQANRSVRNARLDPALPAIAAARAAGHRVLVRASGTEPLIRVMAEGTDAETWADRIADGLPRAAN